MTEDPTQRIIRPDSHAGYAADAPTTAMPGPLNLTGEREPAGDASTTDVLSLDDLFDTEPAPTEAPTASESAPTWTAMPVVSVRSEPMTSAPAAPAPASAASGTAPAAGSRLRSDAAAAWDDTVRRTRAWLARDDNALMLLTTFVAVCLILAVAAFSA